MECPYCQVHVHEMWDVTPMTYRNRTIDFSYRTMACPNCKQWIVEAESYSNHYWVGVFPTHAGRTKTFLAVPEEIIVDYNEACQVLEISPKASAALSRRCLQHILHHNGYKGPNLAKEIDSVVNETDVSKALPSSTRSVLDAIRNFGNFSAHPIDDKTSLQVIDVESHEAEWCLEIIEELFDHYYEKPDLAKKRKADLDNKLLAAGKPPSK